MCNSHVVCVAALGVLLVSGDVHKLACRNREVFVVLGIASADLRALGVEGNGKGAPRLGGEDGAGVVNDGLVIVVGTMREVHANNVEAGIAEGADGLDGIGLGANGADDGGTAVVTLRSVGGVEGGQPSDASANLEMVLGRGGHDAVRAGAAAVLSHCERSVSAEFTRRHGMGCNSEEYAG